MKILAISGSLRTKSLSTGILQAMTKLVSRTIEISHPIEISMYSGIGALPHFNPELDTDPPPIAVQDWRSHLQQSEGVIFCTPEYAHGVPGVLKNALDWIVSSGEFMHKPVVVISASPSPDGGDKANHSLTQTLKVMMAEIPDGTTLCIAGSSAQVNDQGEFVDLAMVEALRSRLHILVKTINGYN